jgi:hypothetical protein
MTSEPMEFALPDIVLIVMLTGIGLMFIGVVMTRIWRKDEITSERLFWAGSDSAAHPERYVKPERVFMVQCINLTAVGLFVAGVLVMVWVTLQRVW